MSKKIPDEYISQLSSKLSDECVESIELEETSELSSERIRQLAMEKRENSKRGESTKVKSRFSKVAAVVALVSVLGVTVYAAGGFDFFKDKFTSGTEHIEQAIESPGISKTVDGKTMTVESILTDGTTTDIIVSITGVKEEYIDDLKLNIVDLDSLSWYNYYQLDKYADKEKIYYLLEIKTTEDINNENLTLKLDKRIADIELIIPVNNKLNELVFEFKESTKYKSIMNMEKFRISSIGYSFEASEYKVQDKPETLIVKMIMKNGVTRDIEIPLPYDEVTYHGGNGIYGSNEEINEFGDFVSNLDGENNFKIDGNFSDVINVNEVEKIVIDGVEYFPN